MTFYHGIFHEQCASGKVLERFDLDKKKFLVKYIISSYKLNVLRILLSIESFYELRFKTNKILSKRSILKFEGTCNEIRGSFTKQKTNKKGTSPSHFFPSILWIRQYTYNSLTFARHNILDDNFAT